MEISREQQVGLLSKMWRDYIIRLRNIASQLEVEDPEAHKNDLKIYLSILSALEGPSEEERKKLFEALADSATSRGWIGRIKEFDAIKDLILGRAAKEGEK